MPCFYESISSVLLFSAVLSHRIAEQGAALGRAGMKIEAVEANSRQLGEQRWVLSCLWTAFYVLCFICLGILYFVC